MNLAGTNVAVVGGAVGGSVAALLLSRAGARVTLFERVPAFGAVGAGIALAPNGLAVLRPLGLQEALEARGCILDAPRIANAAGRTLLRPTLPQGQMLMMRRSDLQEVLVGALESRAIEIRLGSEVSHATPDGTLTVGGESHRFDLVIGADGVHSRIRESGRFGARVRPTGISYVRGLSSHRAALNEEAWTSAGIFGSFPIPGGTYWFCSMGRPDLRDAIAARDVDALRRIWSAALPRAAPLLAGLTTFDELLVNEVIRLDCTSFVDGRLALVGDAAHAMAPNLGQGANSAIVDAAVLVDELLRSPSLEDGLARYDLRRRPAVRWVQDAAEAGGRLSERTGAIFRFFRDQLLMRLAAFGANGRMNRVLQEAPSELEELVRRI